jgi:O-antigen/teichoic acid export membrane protein
MDITKLSTIVALILALSVASERLVEIIKGLLPFLNQENSDPTKEGWRRAALQFLAVAAGIITAVLARPAIPADISAATNPLSILALGLLASGGSGFWNSVLTYVLRIKDIKELDVKEKKKALGENPGVVQ